MNFNYSSALLSSMQASALAAQVANTSGGSGAGQIKRSEVSGLPRGWIREEVPRSFGYHNGLGGTNGSGSHKSDVVYYSPRGHRVRTKQEMSRLLGEAYDLTAFDFQTGKINPNLVKAQMVSSSRAHVGGGRTKQATPTSREQQQNNSRDAAAKTGNANLGIRNDASLVPPIRQTASIFKQPVTVKKNTKVSTNNLYFSVFNKAIIVDKIVTFSYVKPTLRDE